MFRVAVCEDDVNECEDIAARCTKQLTAFDVPHAVSPFSSAEELENVLTLSAQPFDLLLLDIKLPGKTGVEFGASLRKSDDKVGIIFITAYAEYALDGYKAQPCNYLMKPVSDTALTEALRSELKRRVWHQFVTFPEKGKTVRLPVSDILYMESFDHYVRVHTRSETLAFTMSLTQAAGLLPPGVFARCHNSYIVNLSHIRSATSSKVAFPNGEELPVGRAYRNEFSRNFIGHFF